MNYPETPQNMTWLRTHAWRLVLVVSAVPSSRSSSPTRCGARCTPRFTGPGPPRSVADRGEP